METDSERACNNRHVLEEIFGKLPLPVLHKCSRVSRLWYIVANEEKLRRQRILWTMKVLNFEEERQLESVGLLHYHFNVSNKPTRPVVDICAHLHQILSRASSEPKLVLMFICKEDSEEKHEPISDDDQGEQSGGQDTNESTMNVLASYLPQDCKIVSAFVDGFVGTKDLDLPQEILHCAGFTAVCFPNITGVEMFDFTCVDTRSFLTPGNPNVNDRETRIIGLPTNKEIKCILLFVEFETFSSSILQSIQEEYLLNQKCLIALGGVAHLSGVMSSQYYYNDEAVQYSFPEIATGVAFTGRNVHAATVVIEKSVEGQDQVLLKLLALKACDFPEENCVAFLFANVTCHTTKDRVPQRTLEINTFHEVFPNVPLFGAFGDWVFCFEHLLNVQSGNDFNSGLCIDSERSVFVLLSFGER